MSDRLKDLLEGYLAGSESAFDDVAELSSGDPEACWRLLELARAGDLSDRQLAALSAGPFEDLLSRHGEAYLPRVEIAARQDQKMRYLLATVWQGGMDKPTWARVMAIREALSISPA